MSAQNGQDARSHTLAAVGAPMSAIPDASRFWPARTTNGTFLLTWRDFALGRTSTPIPRPSSLVSAQLELFRNGDFIARSNDVESVYRRVNPDDWDGDGWLNEADDDPYAFDADGFGPHQDYPGNLNTNHHYWVELVVSNADALVEFVGDRPSDLPDPKFIAKAGATNRVHLLIGKRYDIRCAMPVCCVDREDADVETWGGERDLTVLWPVRMDYAPHTPLLLMGPRLGSPSGNGVSPILTPSRVRGGSFVWENSFCCCTSAADGTPIFDCNGTCGCAGRCSTGLITYMYSGYSLSFGGWSCNCPVDEHSDDEPEHEAGPSVSARFSTRAVIFEDAYTNMPGVVVPRHSTDVEASYYVSGGTNGGTYAFALVNGAKLLQVDGGTLPVTGHVAAGKSRMVMARYEGRAASDEEGDIVAKAEFVEDMTGSRLTDETATLTAVRVELTAEYDAPENHNPSRHVYGVGERVRFNVSPKSENIAMRVVKSDVSDTVTDYDTFAGELETDASAVRTYTCPATGTPPNITVSYDGLELQPSMQVVEPQYIETRKASGSGTFWPGDVVMGILTTKNYVGPFHVSFSGVQIYEVPCTNAIPPTGYFATTNYTGPLTHDYPQAGYLHIPDSQNYVMTDEAGRTEPYANWFAGALTWKVPIGWRRIRLGHENQLATDEIDHARLRDEYSRPLLIGGREDAYTQTFEIESNGTSSIRKFGYKLERNRWLPFGTVSQTGEN